MTFNFLSWWLIINPNFPAVASRPAKFSKVFQNSLSKYFLASEDWGEKRKENPESAREFAGRKRKMK